MKNRRKENAANEDIILQADAVTDLPITDEQANQIKAGLGTTTGKIYVATDVGVYVS